MVRPLARARMAPCRSTAAIAAATVAAIAAVAVAATVVAIAGVVGVVATARLPTHKRWTLVETTDGRQSRRPWRHAGVVACANAASSRLGRRFARHAVRKPLCPLRQPLRQRPFDPATTTATATAIPAG